MFGMHVDKILKLKIPSTLGSEKTAMDRAAEVASHMGFSSGRMTAKPMSRLRSPRVKPAWKSLSGTREEAQ
jgi:hypothetical protein